LNNELSTPFIVNEIPELVEMVKDHLEDLDEDPEEEIGEIEFDETEFEDKDDFELVSE